MQEQICSCTKVQEDLSQLHRFWQDCEASFQSHGALSFWYLFGLFRVSKGIFWYLWVSFGIFWYLFGIFLAFLGYLRVSFGIFGYLSVSFGIFEWFWDIFESSVVSVRCFLVSVCYFQNMCWSFIWWIFLKIHSQKKVNKHKQQYHCFDPASQKAAIGLFWYSCLCDFLPGDPCPKKPIDTNKQ